MASPGPLRLAFALAVAPLAFSADDLPRGQIIDRVACAKDSTQAYALYLPAGYTATHPWPVLLCFDPGANGRRGVERFAAAAEKFGWVVARSLNSRNGPWAANAVAINALMQDLMQRVPLDSRRVYAGGLSGGARVACQIALNGKLIAGVIACSAGIAGGEVPETVPFALFGTAGIEDFNYVELRRLDAALEQHHATHRVEIFPGGHEWLPAPLAEEALAWFELQAMRAGTRPRDDAFVAAQWTSRRAAVPPQPVEENFHALKAIAADFKGLTDTAELEKQVAALAASREVRAALKADRALLDREEERISELVELTNDGSIKAVRKQAAVLRAEAEAPDDSATRRIARRVIASATMGGREYVRSFLDAHEYSTAAAWLELSVALRPDRPQTFFDLARAYALTGDKKAALTALQQAAAAGFQDAARLAAEPAFEKLRSEPAFLQLAAAMRP